MVVDRGVGGGEYLKCLHVPEFSHRPFTSSKRLMRVFRPIVAPAPALLRRRIPDRHHRCAVGRKSVGHDSLWPAIPFHRSLQKPKRSLADTTLGNENLKDFTLVVHSALQIQRATDNASCR